MWPISMTLKFNRVLKVVEVRVRAKLHQPKCSGFRDITLTEKKLSSLPRTLITQKDKVVQRLNKKPSKATQTASLQSKSKKNLLIPTRLSINH